ncbi:MAG TPA: EAL domain-containing protein, partial [Candidatus Eremiobacteraceae bacterium]|nr:EAL domain-containing protein [Candidatus Eremiobacteraceae bacterium]
MRQRRVGQPGAHRRSYRSFPLQSASRASLRLARQRRPAPSHVRDRPVRASYARAIGFCLLDELGRFVGTSWAAASALGARAADLCGTSAFDHVVREDVNHVKAAFADAWKRRTPTSTECRVRAAGGRVRTVSLEACVLSEPRSARVLAVSVRLISPASSPQLKPEIAADAPINCRSAVIHWDLDFTVTGCDDGAERLFGFRTADLMGKSAFTLIARGSDRARLRELRHSMLASRCGTTHQLRCKTSDGRTILCDFCHAPVLDSHGAVVSFASSAIALIAERAVPRTSRLPELATHDGVLSRALVCAHLDRAIASARREKANVAVLLVDCSPRPGPDGAGVVAARLRSCLREADCVGRTSDGTYLVLLDRVASRAAATTVVDRVIDSLAEPIPGPASAHIAASSVGVALFPDDAADADALVRCAGAALALARESGRDAYRFYSDTGSPRKPSLAAQLERAIAREELELHYQPQVAYPDARVIGVEALVRWRHPQRRLVPPAEFIPVAEESDLIIDLGRFVLREACSTMRRWLDAGIAVPRITVNVSGREFRRRMVDDVAKVLCETDLDPGLLELELTESVTMQPDGGQPKLLDDLRALGLRLAIDDFGVGYSSLAYLQRFPIDT